MPQIPPRCSCHSYRCLVLAFAPLLSVLLLLVPVALVPQRATAKVKTPAPRNAAEARTSAPPTIVIAGGKTTVTIPFRFQDEHIHIPVWLNGKGPYDFLLDTGANVNVVSSETALEVGLSLRERADKASGGGEAQIEMKQARGVTFRLGEAGSEVTVSDQVFYALPLPPQLQRGGLLGRDFFQQFVVAIDYENQRLTLTLPKAFKGIRTETKESSDATASVPIASVPLAFRNGIPEVEGEIDGVRGVFAVDTGAAGALTLFPAFAETNHLHAKYNRSLEMIVGRGVGGAIRGQMARAGVFQIGKGNTAAPGMASAAEVRGFILDISRQKRGIFSSAKQAGNIGAGILSQFNLTLDYSRKRMFLVKNKRHGLPASYNRSGMAVEREGSAVRVVEVVPGTPAAEAGIREGDTLLVLDGKSGADLTHSFLREAVRRAPGTALSATVGAPNGPGREVTILLRELL